MNVFDCHVNRAPSSGEIKDIFYKPGKFLNASLDKASEENERNYFKINDNKTNDEEKYDTKTAEWQSYLECRFPSASDTPAVYLKASTVSSRRSP